MEPKTTAALAYLEQDPLLHADMLAAIRRENADIRYAGPEGVLLIETGDRVPMLSMEDTVLASRLIRDCLPFGQVVVHQMSLLPCTRRAGLVGNAPCYQAVYTAQAPPEVSMATCWAKAELPMQGTSRLASFSADMMRPASCCWAMAMMPSQPESMILAT